MHENQYMSYDSVKYYSLIWHPLRTSKDYARLFHGHDNSTVLMTLNSDGDHKARYFSNVSMFWKNLIFYKSNVCRRDIPERHPMHLTLTSIVRGNWMSFCHKQWVTLAYRSIMSVLLSTQIALIPFYRSRKDGRSNEATAGNANKHQSIM